MSDQCMLGHAIKCPDHERTYEQNCLMVQMLISFHPMLTGLEVAGVEGSDLSFSQYLPAQYPSVNPHSRDFITRWNPVQPSHIFQNPLWVMGRKQYMIGILIE